MLDTSRTLVGGLLVAAALSPLGAVLQAQDVTGNPTLPLTQEFLSHVLGVRRSSVSIMAHKIQQGGMIRYTRGNITILDREGLEECACECYGTLRSELKAAFS